jgi:hypothetical protein
VTDWLISTPAWGDRCVKLACEVAIPAIKLALAQRSGGHRFVVHTDQPERMGAVLRGSEHTLLPVPSGENSHYSLGNANRDAIRMARTGEAIAFINADMVPSIEAFSAAEHRFAEGKRLIMCASNRTLAAEYPPIGARARNLLRWGWEHRHPWIADCTFHAGRAAGPTVVLFERNGNVVMHGFHVHPFAALKEWEFTFNLSTTDHDLIDAFPRAQVHFVTDPDELAFTEISPREREFGQQPHRLGVLNIAGFAKPYVSLSHRWAFGHQIVIIGRRSLQARLWAMLVLTAMSVPGCVPILLLPVRIAHVIRSSWGNRRTIRERLIQVVRGDRTALTRVIWRLRHQARLVLGRFPDSSV